MAVTIVLVDDHQVIIDGVRAMLAPYADRVTMVGSAKTRAELFEVLESVHPDLIVTDARLTNDSGFEILEDLQRRGVAVPVVFYSAYDDEAYLFRALRAGARGYLLKQASGEELVGMLERAAGGETMIDAALAGRVALLAARLQFGEFWPGAHLGLTQRESEILDLVVKGLSNRDIAQRLFLGEETVKTHLSSIYRKLKVKGRAEAIAVALREVRFR
ncbi:two component transcriptional regulator, LuxR family [Acidimicrobium ferrooxidans DSM 10331]|uniref:Two component transcriptional regulator, LuxR family n=1 Tax=Acidimicrobium ferrooxidans (strain DSM 10331 / JCM 15462 / NBRC 103882 / ICP) TaxID=525909 RepID=C7M251_ACIFD|nr:response regulator transcription factor [Acidimicrobium ferrooxidans]ACU53149.1 two component transcriptional regulator, LuxR family [Acidimicrobium ferrooxidans DSM 10331]